jgi:4-amino-4-deoxy-L-arabinose transferase-like glycosyltransferase
MPTDTGRAALPNLIHRLVELAPVALAAVLFSRHLFADLYGDEWGHTRSLVIGSTFWRDLLAPEMCHPPLYFILARMTWLATNSEWAMRLPSLLAALATVWTAGLLAGKVGGRNLVAPARWLAACSPFLMDFATEARAYAMLLLFSTASVWAFLRMMDGEDRRGALILAATLTAGMLTHYFFGFLLGYLLLWYVCKRSRFTVPAAIAFAPPILAAALFGTLVFLVQGGAASAHLQAEWMREHLHIPNFLARLAVAVNYGYCTFWLPPLDPARNVPAGVVTRNIPQFIMLGVAAIGFATAFWRLLKARTRYLAFLSFGLVVPTLVAVCAGAMGIYLIREKHLAVIWPFALILAAMAVHSLFITWLGRIAAAAHIALIVLSAVHFLVFPNVYSRRMDWTGLRAAIASARKPDVVLIYRLDARAAPQPAFTTDAQRADFLVVRGSLRPGETLVGLAQRLHAGTAGRILLVSHETDRHIDDPLGLIPKTLASLRPAAVTPYGRNLLLYVYAPERE